MEQEHQQQRQRQELQVSESSERQKDEDNSKLKYAIKRDGLLFVDSLWKEAKSKGADLATAVCVKHYNPESNALRNDKDTPQSGKLKKCVAKAPERLVDEAVRLRSSLTVTASSSSSSSSSYSLSSFALKGNDETRLAAKSSIYPIETENNKYENNNNQKDNSQRCKSRESKRQQQREIKQEREFLSTGSRNFDFQLESNSEFDLAAESNFNSAVDSTEEASGSGVGKRVCSKKEVSTTTTNIRTDSSRSSGTSGIELAKKSWFHFKAKLEGGMQSSADLLRNSPRKSSANKSQYQEELDKQHQKQQQQQQSNIGDLLSSIIRERKLQASAWLATTTLFVDNSNNRPSNTSSMSQERQQQQANQTKGFKGTLAKEVAKEVEAERIEEQEKTFREATDLRKGIKKQVDNELAAGMSFEALGDITATGFMSDEVNQGKLDKPEELAGARIASANDNWSGCLNRVGEFEIDRSNEKCSRFKSASVDEDFCDVKLTAAICAHNSPAEIVNSDLFRPNSCRICGGAQVALTQLASSSSIQVSCKQSNVNQNWPLLQMKGQEKSPKEQSCLENLFKSVANSECQLQQQVSPQTNRSILTTTTTTKTTNLESVLSGTLPSEKSKTQQPVTSLKKRDIIEKERLSRESSEVGVVEKLKKGEVVVEEEKRSQSNPNNLCRCHNHCPARLKIIGPITMRRRCHNGGAGKRRPLEELKVIRTKLATGTNAFNSSQTGTPVCMVEEHAKGFVESKQSSNRSMSLTNESSASCIISDACRLIPDCQLPSSTCNQVPLLIVASSMSGSKSSSQQSVEGQPYEQQQQQQQQQRAAMKLETARKMKHCDNICDKQDYDDLVESNDDERDQFDQFSSSSLRTTRCKANSISSCATINSQQHHSIRLIQYNTNSRCLLCHQLSRQSLSNGSSATQSSHRLSFSPVSQSQSSQHIAEIKENASNNNSSFCSTTTATSSLNQQKVTLNQPLHSTTNISELAHPDFRQPRQRNSIQNERTKDYLKPGEWLVSGTTSGKPRRRHSWICR